MLTDTLKITSDLSKLKDLERHCRTLNKRHIRFGWYEGKNYPADHDNRGISIAQVAYWQEYGYGAIPSRPYFRQAVNKVKRGTRGQIKTIFLTGIHGNNISSGLQRLADSIVLEYQKSVATLQESERLYYTAQRSLISNV